MQKEENARIRKRYNLRTDYDAELKEICRVQGLSDDVYKKLWKAIVWQRPLRSQKGLVGICTFEKNKSRCPVSHPLYEEYRTWIFINNLKISVPENVDKASYLKEKIYPLFYNASTDFKLSSILKQLKRDGSVMQANFKDDTKVISSKLLNSFEKLFGENWKNELGWQAALNNQLKPCNYSFEDIWHVLFTFDSTEKLKDFATSKLNLSEENAEKFSKIKLQQGYATLSLSAIKKILPYLYKGFIYSEVIYLANLPKVFGNKNIDESLTNNFETIYRQLRKEHDEEKILNACVNDLIRNELNSDQRYRIEDNRDLDEQENKLIEEKVEEIIGSKSWNKKTEEERASAKSYVSRYFKAFLQKPVHGKKDELFLPMPNLHERIKTHLKNTYEIDDKHLDYLWHPSEQETYPNAKEIKLENAGTIKQLGDPQPISRGFKNPMALKTLHKLKRLLNYLLQTGKIDEDTRVVVEIARELNDANKRKAIEKWQRDREKENEDFKKIIDEINKECATAYDREDKTLIDKIRLWKEQNMMCLYTGKQIKSCDVFIGTKYDIEHSIPASMSFDNELKNLTIADAYYNREIKKKKIPFDCPNYFEEVTINGNVYKPIIKNIEIVFGERKVETKKIRGKEVEFISYERIEHLKEQVDFWKKQTRIASTKKRKDDCIQFRHYNQMELDYWRKKLETFTCEEYKSGWRNSQLKDTQTITKYTLPYLKTVFNKIEVQKARQNRYDNEDGMLNIFKKIYQIKGDENKERAKHSHHAIDAAVLTLIPPAIVRDKILLRYNEAKENKLRYHEKPRQWNNFHQRFIIGIEEDILINYQAQHRTLTQTYKNVRKRGKQQFVKYKDTNGKWHFKLDEKGNKIPLTAKGDTVRGQLHEESFMTLIKQPEYEFKNNKYYPKTDGNGSFIFQQKDGNDELFVVKKILLSELDSLDKFKKIVDLNLRSYLTTLINNRMQSGKSFQQAISEPIWAFDKTRDKNGNPINPLRHIRCKVSKAAGFLSKEKTLDIRKNEFVSKFSHKRDVLAGNDEMVVCLYFENNGMRNFKLLSRFELAILKIKNVNDLFNNPNYNKTLKGTKKVELPLYHIIQSGMKVILLDEKINTIEELKGLDTISLSKRLFVVNNFNTPAGNTIYIYLVNHIDARQKEVLQKNEEKNIDTSKYQAKLALTADKFFCVIEGKHFEIKPDGEIKWKF
ncbi:MAG TPA: HNH endonuclease domain-containing protein [Puia sp.]|nr:HNH endonuclease domain-containing protein [Puia sp.]